MLFLFVEFLLLLSGCCLCESAATPGPLETIRNPEVTKKWVTPINAGGDSGDAPGVKHNMAESRQSRHIRRGTSREDDEDTDSFGSKNVEKDALYEAYNLLHTLAQVSRYINGF